MRIGIDIDDTLREFASTLDKLLQRDYPTLTFNSNIPTWGYTHINFPDEIKKDISIFWREKYIKELIYDAPTCYNAIEGFKRIRNWADLAKHKLICVSNQSHETLPGTLEWLGKHNFRFDEIHFVSDKTSVHIDFLIDDSPKYYDQWICNKRQKTKFILIDQPYNQQLYHDFRAKDLIDAHKLLLTLM